MSGSLHCFCTAVWALDSAALCDLSYMARLTGLQTACVNLSHTGARADHWCA